MAGTVTEQTRALHEDIEWLEDAAVKFLLEEPRTHKETVNQSHRVAQVLQQMNKKKDTLITVYKDIDNSRQEDIEALGGGGQAVFSVFYNRLRDIKDYHRRFPNIPIADPSVIGASITGSADIPFSTEEVNGKYLDLHEFHDRYNNLPWNRPTPVDYFAYLRRAYHFPRPVLAGKGEEYVQYLRDLYEYTVGLIRRAQPLSDLDDSLAGYAADFEKAWAEQSFDGETHVAPTDEAEAEAGQEEGAVPATYCLDCLRGYGKAVSFNGHLAGKKHKKNVARYASLEKETFELQYMLHRLGEQLAEQLQSTKIHVETKLARRYEDLEAEQEEEELPDMSDSDSEEEGDEMTRRCITNYPVGWDGKPIPYWLYKLHGLGIEYKCEICGNTSYWGRRAYERHFQEARHVYGMKCLGITNSKAFHEITNINDALALWEKMQKDESKKGWNPQEQEEYEDADGNVMIRKTYKDLQRQGLLTS